MAEDSTFGVEQIELDRWIDHRGHAKQLLDLVAIKAVTRYQRYMVRDVLRQLAA